MNVPISHPFVHLSYHHPHSSDHLSPSLALIHTKFSTITTYVEHIYTYTAITPCLQLGHIITHPSHHHDIFINIATQNVGGLKSESERGSGPKISTLRVLAKEKLDFLVLTETRVDVRAAKKIKLKRNLHATMQSLHPRPRGGGPGFFQERTQTNPR